MQGPGSQEGPCYGLNICVPPSIHTLGFPHSSVGKESACIAGDSGSIPGSGRSAGEGRGYPLQYSWAYLPAMQETQFQFLHWEDLLEKGEATHSSILT